MFHCKRLREGASLCKSNNPEVNCINKATYWSFKKSPWGIPLSVSIL